MLIPPYLKEGDLIGICAPAGACTVESVQPMITQLEFWGFEVKLGATIGTTYNKFSGTDSERLKDFQTMLNDDKIKAILFARGGYGFARIIDYVSWDKYKKNPKWLVGYSDITVLHNHAHRHIPTATIHAHMSGGYQAEGFDNDSTMSIYYALTGKSTEIVLQTSHTSETNTCTGPLIGGNLAVLCSLIGTPSDIDYTGKILVIEDIAEPRYKVDRMMYQLFRSGKLDNLAGLIVGGFTESSDEEFGMNEYEIIWEKVHLYNYPVCFGFPVGHQSLNKALKFGVQHELSINSNNITLKELAV